MDSTKDIQKLHDVLSSAEYNSDLKEFTFSQNIFEVEKYFNNIHVQTSKFGGKLQVNKDKLPIRLFIDDKEFREECTLTDFEEDILIINKESISRCFLKDKLTTFYNFQKADSNQYYFTNSKTYRLFCEFLKRKSLEKSENSEFIDYYDTTGNKAFFTSSDYNLRLIIPLQHSIPEFDENTNLLENYNSLIKLFDNNNKYYPVFLKNEIIDTLIPIDIDQRITLLLNDLGLILERTNRNFKAYLHKLSIRQIKADYKDYKSKYFSELSDLLGNMGTAIFGLPIAVIGAVFTIFEISESPQGLILVFIVLVILSILISILLFYYKNDLDYLYDSVELDHLKFLANPFFDEFPDEKKDFNSIKGKLDSKINSLKYFILLLFVVSQILIILLLSLIINKLGFSPTYIYSFAIVFVLFNSVVFSRFFLRNEVINV